MEVRILDATVPDAKPVWGAVPDVTEPADAALRGPLRQALCGEKEAPASFALTARHHVRRNAAQHLTIAKTADLQLAISKAPNAPGVEALCGDAPATSSSGPEWFLRVRDNLFRAKSRQMP
jgi:hypothetical protein